ncbi:hypothetical protein [Peptostreptococcus russellii]|uniref:hypothetical protein n=1 Tax=Peptostreptococcus russellii TaxID=215200 RepID=UPI0029431779|nr:hypothetical protein [Peptostreptococcus russellii]
MYAILENREHKIDEADKAIYLAEGYSIYDDSFDLVDQPGQDASNEEIEKLKAENKKLKAENTKLKNKLKAVEGEPGRKESEGQ